MIDYTIVNRYKIYYDTLSKIEPTSATITKNIISMEIQITTNFLKMLQERIIDLLATFNSWESMPLLLHLQNYRGIYFEHWWAKPFQ